MNRTIFFRTAISVAQKTRESGSYGDGFNYHIEVGVSAHLGLDENLILRQIASVTGELDHKALGIDFDLGQEPTSVFLTQWLEARLKTAIGGAYASVRLIRGDGAEFSIL
jgi:hypothetical protein